MIRKILFASCFSIIGLSVLAQNNAKIGATKAISTNTVVKKAKGLPAHRTCATPVMSEAELMQFEQGMQQSIAHINAEEAQNGSNKTAAVIYTIPVVVHVIYNNGEAVGSGRNISAAQVTSQITAMNKDYTMTNTDIGSVPAAFSSVKADCQINFCLAQRTPTGAAMSEPGIDRLNRTTKGWNDPGTMSQSAFQTYVDGTIKPNSVWDPTKYLNIWVCDANTSGLLGYATFPAGVSGGSGMGFTSSLGTASTDGVVINYQGFGTTGSAAAPYNKGRTVTHEVGHWLGLFHTFQGGCAGTSSSNCSTQGDMCCDTPPTSNQSGNFSCPGTQNTCTETPTDQNDMTMNYMDYTDDACMYMFTANQKTRIMAVMNPTTGGTYRKGLNGSNSCTPPGGAVAPVANFTGCNSNFTVGNTVTFTDASTNAPTSWAWAITPATGWAYAGGTTSTSQNPQVTFSTAGTYQVALTATNSAGNNTHTTAGCMVVVAGGGTGGGGCDTLSNIGAADTLTCYKVSTTAANWGYLTGMNYYIDKAKANLYSGANYTAGNTLRGAYYYFYKAKYASAASNVNCRAWDNDGTNSVPMTVLGTKNLLVNSIPTNGYVYVPFASPIAVSGDFYMGLEFNTNAGATAYSAADTVAIVSNTIYNATNTAYEMWSDGTWYAFSDPADYSINMSMAIFPVLCPVTVGFNNANDIDDVTLFPNPSNGMVSIMIGLNTESMVNIKVINALGQIVKSNKIQNGNGGKVDFDLSSCSNGVYFVEIQTSKSIVTKRLVLNK